MQSLLSIFVATLMLLQVLQVPNASAADSTECSNGRVYDTTSKRCVVREVVADQKYATQECAKLSDKEAKKCYAQVANQAAIKGEESGEIPKLFRIKHSKAGAYSAVSTLVTTSFGLSALRGLKNKSFCKAPSFGIMLAAGLVSIGGELTSYGSYRLKTNKLKRDFNKRSLKKTDGGGDGFSDEDILAASDNQIDAFDFLIENEKAKQDAMNIRVKAYRTAMRLYAAAAASALVELILSKKFPSSKCNVSFNQRMTPINPESLSYYPKELKHFSHLNPSFLPTNMEEAKEFALRILSQLSINAYAQEKSSYEEKSGEDHKKLVGAGVGVMASYLLPKALVAISKELEKSYKNLMRYPVTRGVLSVAMGGYTYTVMQTHKDARRNSEIRVQKMQEIKKEFAQSGGASFDSCVGKRDNPQFPACYCYNSDKSQNQRRRLQNICKRQWGSSDFDLAANSYGPFSDKGSSPKGCLTTQGIFSPGCSCRYERDLDKKCQTMQSNFNLGNAPLNSWLNGVAADTNDVLSGKTALADMNPATMRNNAMRATKILDQLAADKKAQPFVKKIQDELPKLTKSLENTMRRANGGSMPSSSTSDLLASNANFTPSELTDPKKLQDAITEVKKAATNLSATTESTDQGFDFDLDEPLAQGSSVTIEELDEVMQEDFDYKGDINNNPSNNLFDILSLRYQRSGMRSLFDEERKYQADKANKSDINK